MADDTREKYILLAVNGTLMRGLELEGNLLEAGAEFGFGPGLRSVTDSGAYVTEIRP